MKRFFLIALIALLAVPASSQETHASSPEVQTHFLGISFGDSKAKVYDMLSADGYDVIEGPLNCLIIRSVYFGGHYWNVCSFGFAKDAFIDFSAHMGLPTGNSIKVLYDGLLRELNLKYPMKSLFADGTGYSYKDSEGNTVYLFLHNDSSLSLSYKSFLEESKKKEELDEF